MSTPLFQFSKATGFVGIGTSNAQSNLHVIGNTYHTGNLEVQTNITLNNTLVPSTVTLPPQNILSAGALDPNSNTIVLTAYGSNYTVTLPDASTVGTLVTLRMPNLDSPYVVTVQCTGATYGLRGSFNMGPGSTNAVKTLVWTGIGWQQLDAVADSFYPSTQQGLKLVGTGGTVAGQGFSVALSADGNTLAVGGYLHATSVGAVWVFTRTGTTWTQQGTRLIGTGTLNTQAGQGYSIALSADGNTLVSGGYLNNANQGAVWVFTRNTGVWTQQGTRLIGTGFTLSPGFGVSCALTPDGNTLAFSGYTDNTNVGAVWIFTRTAGVWTQQGTKLIGTGAVGAAQQGRFTLVFSGDGNVLGISGYGDNANVGATWVFTRTGTTWTQLGLKLVGTGNSGACTQCMLALSADANTLAVGGFGDNPNGTTDTGAVWVFTRLGGIYVQQGLKLVSTGGISGTNLGRSVALSADGNTLAAGGFGHDVMGATWVFTRAAGTWRQRGTRLIGTGYTQGATGQGISVALSSDGSTMATGSRDDNAQVGAVWVFT